MTQKTTQNPSHYVVKTLGCKANLYDSQLIEQELQKKGWVSSSSGKLNEQEPVKLCIVNTCTVTNEADKQSRKMAESLARDYPGAAIVMTGCGVEVNPESYARSPGVTYVVGNQDKHQLVSLVESQFSSIDSHIHNQPSSDLVGGVLPGAVLGTVRSYAEILSRHPLDREWPVVTESFLSPPVQIKGHSFKTRSFLKIQEGCDSFCTFCIIPYGRGPNRSLRPKEVIQQVRELVEQGIREVIITGTNIGDYGLDWSSEPMLGDLLTLILEETSLQRLRVSSLDPTEITPQIISLMKNNPRFCPHFHVSVQSPHSRILRLMKRKYRFEELRDCLQAISEITLSTRAVGGVFVGMDLITGFPGETEEEFEWTYETLSALPWSRLHVFPYSERAGTPATRLPGAVPQHIRVKRTKLLNELSLKRLRQLYQSVLENCRLDQLSLDSVLIEKVDKKNRSGGYTPNYLRVILPETRGIAKDTRGITTDLACNDLVNVKPIDLMVDPAAGDVAFVCSLV